MFFIAALALAFDIGPEFDAETEGFDELTFLLKGKVVLPPPEHH
jgi:hypothetical protein